MANTKHSISSSNREKHSLNTSTRVRSSLKRPRAPIACIRCHHKKIRCDGEHPNCARCTQGGILCAYPSSRRSRNTPPTSMDPFIDNLSQLEIKIQQIEADLEYQRSLFSSFKMGCPTNVGMLAKSTKNILCDTPSDDTLKNQPQLELTRKRSSHSYHSGTVGSRGSKRQKRSLATPSTSKINTIFPSSPSSTTSNLPKSMGNGKYIGHSPPSVPQNYVLDPITYQTDWTQSSSAGAVNDMTSYAIYPTQPQQPHYSPYNVYQQRPLFLSQQLSPVTTPDYTDDSSDQFNLTTPTPSISFHYANTINNSSNEADHSQHYYSLPSSTYQPYSLTTTSSSSTHSTSTNSLNHIPSSSCPPVSPQRTSCQMINLYNSLTMNDLISFDSQNTSMSLIENAVWYC